MYGKPAAFHMWRADDEFSGGRRPTVPAFPRGIGGLSDVARVAPLTTAKGESIRSRGTPRRRKRESAWEQTATEIKSPHGIPARA